MFGVDDTTLQIILAIIGAIVTILGGGYLLRPKSSLVEEYNKITNDLKTVNDTLDKRGAIYKEDLKHSEEKNRALTKRLDELENKITRCDYVNWKYQELIIWACKIWDIAFINKLEIPYLNSEVKKDIENYKKENNGE